MDVECSKLYYYTKGIDPAVLFRKKVNGRIISILKFARSK